MVAIVIKREKIGCTPCPARRQARRPGGWMTHSLRRRRLTRLDVAMNDTAVTIVSAFFVIRILVGIIGVIAMSVPWAKRRGYPGDLGGLPARERPSLPWDDTEPNRHPRWLGDGDDDFRGR